MFSSFALIALSWAFNSPNGSAKSPFASPGWTNQAKTLAFADRVAYQRAVEEIYWRHRDWPATDGSAKPSLDQVMPQAQIEKKVEDYLRNSQALEDYWQKPITSEQLQAEMERMARHTRQPEVLREIFAALGNDPYVIAECLARPALADRLARNLYAHDERFHGDLKRRAEAELAAHGSVKQMKQASGTYSEMEWIKSDEKPIVGQSRKLSGLPTSESAGEAPALQQQDRPNTIKLDSTEWNDNVQKLAAAFGSADVVATPLWGVGPGVPMHRRDVPQARGYSAVETKSIAQSYQTIPVGKLTQLQEDEDHYYATAVISKGKDQLKLATVSWLKQPFDSWRAKAETQMPVTMAAQITADYRLPVIGSPSGQCSVDTWTATALGAPEARYYHTAVWTGSEMIVWGGYAGFGYLNTGRRYDPATDTWTATSTINAPTARYYHTAVWTGAKMIVWGGLDSVSGYSNTGGQYDPVTDSWTATSTTNAPDARYQHTAVWTGTRMVVWGGYDNVIGYSNTGGRYDPVTDSWAATSTTCTTCTTNRAAPNAVSSRSRSGRSTPSSCPRWPR